MSRTQDQKRFRRHLRKATRAGGPWCALCEQPAPTGLGLEWLDAPMHPEREAIFFVVCPSCQRTPYAEQLNLLHRRAWQARQAGKGQGAWGGIFRRTYDIQN